MDELIRKQDAIDAVNRALDRETLLNRLVRKVTIDAIRIVSPVQSDVPEMNVGRWIPVSERLPQSDPEDLEYPTVIICLPDGSVELGCFYESTKEWGAGENFDRLRNPVAWMPLPEPYKEGEENG